MTFVRLIGGAALLASATAGMAETAASPLSPSTAAKPLKAAKVRSSVRLEYTDFSKLYGSRTVLTADSRLGTGQSTRYIVSASAGQRKGGGATNRAAQASATIDHDWSDRLSTQTTGAVASNGLVFARTMIGQDISYKLGHGLVGTIGGKYSSYDSGNHVAAWSAGAAYYLRGGFLSYRYSLYASNRFGRSHAHLASFRINDPGGSGSTQLWAGHGTSIFEAELPQHAAGKFTSVALQRVQPIGGGVALNLGVNHAWYRTPVSRYTGNGVSVGLTFANWPL